MPTPYDESNNGLLASGNDPLGVMSAQGPRFGVFPAHLVSVQHGTQPNDSVIVNHLRLQAKLIDAFSLGFLASQKVEEERAKNLIPINRLPVYGLPQ